MNNLPTPLVSSRRALALALACSAALPCAAIAQDDTIAYRETFGNSTGANISYGAVGWSFYWNQGGTSTTAGTAVNRTNPGTAGNPGTLTGTAITNSAHSPLSTATNIGQDQVSQSATNGLGFYNATDATVYFGFTEEYNGSFGTITSSNLSSISFINSSVNAWNHRAAVRVGDDWFVTEAQPGYVTSNTFQTDVQILTFSNLSNASWVGLNFTPGAALGLGAPIAELPAGTITAFGFYSTDGTGASSRVDDFTVTISIPEPSAFAAVAGLGVLGLAALRRRRSV